MMYKAELAEDTRGSEMKLGLVRICMHSIDCMLCSNLMKS